MQIVARKEALNQKEKRWQSAAHQLIGIDVFKKKTCFQSERQCAQTQDKQDRAQKRKVADLLESRQFNHRLPVQRDSIFRSRISGFRTDVP